MVLFLLRNIKNIEVTSQWSQWGARHAWYWMQLNVGSFTSFIMSPHLKYFQCREKHSGHNNLVKRLHDQGNFYKRKHLIGAWLQLQGLVCYHYGGEQEDTQADISAGEAAEGVQQPDPQASERMRHLAWHGLLKPQCPSPSHIFPQTRPHL